MTKRYCILIPFLITTIALGACNDDETTEEPTGEILVGATLTSRTYPGPVIDSGYPGQVVDSGYPAPQQPTKLPSVPPGDARFPGKLAFHSEQAGGGLQVYLFDGQDGSVTPVTGGVTQGYEPTWSQDCQSLIYTQQIGAEIVDLYITHLETREALPFLETARNDTLDWSAVWSPQGDLVAYLSNPGAKINICLADGTGADLGCQDRQTYDNANPAFSPDGEEMVFVSNRDGDWEIYVTGVDGNGVERQLTDNSYSDLNPKFSPDGKYIVFASDATATFDIYRMRPDGSEVTRLTNLIENEKEPEWIGDDLIVFSSNEDSDYDLYIMSADGDNLRQITNYVGKDGGANWCHSE
jgi:TolB protein